ncbi:MULTISPECIES: DUF2298 domain-containing protein [Halorussus]|uniref:DUF2298 domain-containing protein n=1 Tax=Halorussus TaxID=1070314 RepID=UPI0020A04BEE|nr:DUF2298 domain-containing protein [Halorussus vallis]USZ75556.1 DUF2298 domain-containing protein [Halorussus vallis]
MEYALVLLWFVAFQALALAGLPLATRLFPRFPDRGASFALPVALVVVTAVDYWVGHLAFSRATAFASVAVLAAASLFLVWTDRSLRDEDADAIDSDYLPTRAYAESAVVFAIAFALLVAVRAVDPSIHAAGGEKFLDFGILKSLLRADALPPEDMWWAGAHVLYYYGGHLMAAILTQLTGTEAQYAYNLALAGFYATLVTAAYGLAGALADARGASRRAAGALGGFFVGFGGNLVVPVTAAVWLLPDSVASGVANWVAATLREEHAGELVRTGLSEFHYWAPSRVIPETINEFPMFAFLNGDLHAHMLSTPFLLLVAALGFAYFRTDPAASARRRALAFGALPVVVALLGFVNVWSFPTGLGVVWLALLFAPADPFSLFPGVTTDRRATTATDGGPGERSPAAALRLEARRIAGAFAATGVVAVVALALVSPFVFGILLRSAGNRSIGTFPTPASAMALFLIHGAFLVPFALYLWARTRETLAVDPARFAALAAALAVVAWFVGYAVVALVVPLLVVGWLLLRTDADCGYETVLVVAGAGLVTLVEFVYVVDSAAPGRMNTVFKVYMQVWVLWGVAAGAVVAALMADAGPTSWRLPSVGLSREDAMAGLAVVLVVSSGGFGALALAEHFTSDDPIHRADDPTLNGTAFTEKFHPHEAEAIRWLDRKEGQPHIVSPPGHQVYSWTSPAASLTGLPTAIGWVYHEGIYRGHETAEHRAADVELIYTGPWNSSGPRNDRAELLKEYDVKYIYVGPEARDRYSEQNLQFGRYPGIEVAFQNEGVTIYRVDQSKF